MEVLVTLLLVGLATALLASLISTQSRVQRKQESVNRFMVDANAFLNALQQELGSAYAVEGSTGGSILRVGYLLATEGGVKPKGVLFEAEEGTAPPQRGQYHKVSYNQQGEELIRQDPGYDTFVRADKFIAFSPSSFALEAPAGERVVLTGVQAAQATLNESRLDFRVTLDFQTRLMTLESVFFCPGLTE